VSNPPRWRKSTLSGSTGGQCVEVAAPGDGLIRVRDSKDPSGPQLVVTPGCWARSLLRFAGAAVTDGQALHAEQQGGLVILHAPEPDSTSLRFTAGEWNAFLAGVRQGEFAMTATGFATPDTAPLALPAPARTLTFRHQPSQAFAG